jgi:hypothetical protein
MLEADVAPRPSRSPRCGASRTARWTCRGPRRSSSRRATPTATARCTFPDRDALIAGDAIVTLDPYTGRRGPQIVARAATAHADEALPSLDALEATGAGTVLTGHGEPWRDGIAEACRQGRAVGVH